MYESVDGWMHDLLGGRVYKCIRLLPAPCSMQLRYGGAWYGKGTKEGVAHMDFRIPEALREIRLAVREFVEKKVFPQEQVIEEEDRIPEELVEGARELGLFGLGIPAAYGGLGLDMVGKCAVIEELGRGHAGFAAFLGAHTGIGSAGLVMAGSETLKQKYLPAMAAGEKIAAFALTEPGAGSDASALKTTAVKKGDRWIINGVKHFITNAPEAALVTTMAVTDPLKGARGITAFVVERDFPGFQVGPVEQKMGLRGCHTAKLFFEQCEVPAENVLGKENEGYLTALKTLANGRAALAIRCVGACKRLIDLPSVTRRRGCSLANRLLKTRAFSGCWPIWLWKRKRPER